MPCGTPVKASQTASKKSSLTCGSSKLHVIVTPLSHVLDGLKSIQDMLVRIF